MVVRPSGRLGLCCNDALGQVTLGDLNRQSLVEAWNGPAYVAVREKILQGREHIPQCGACTNAPFYFPQGRRVGEFIPEGPFLIAGQLRFKSENAGA
jgi:hypothetical protein